MTSADNMAIIIFFILIFVFVVVVLVILYVTYSGNTDDDTTCDNTIVNVNPGSNVEDFMNNLENRNLALPSSSKVLTKKKVNWFTSGNPKSKNVAAVKLFNNESGSNLVMLNKDSKISETGKLYLLESRNSLNIKLPNRDGVSVKLFNDSNVSHNIFGHNHIPILDNDNDSENFSIEPGQFVTLHSLGKYWIVSSKSNFNISLNDRKSLSCLNLADGDWLN